jgi:hypothetical protein
MITIEGDEIVLSSGKRVYAHCAIIGLCLSKGNRSDNLEVFGGYDQSIPWPMPDWWPDEEKKESAARFLSNVEMKELADYMADRWKQFSRSLV